jgi:hypothetical protein
MKDLRTDSGDVCQNMPPQFDRRLRDRIALRIPVRILSRGWLMEKSADGICVDLSEGGLAFDSDAPLTVGEIVVLEFQQKGETAYRCHARLTYRFKQRYGGYFLTGD